MSLQSRFISYREGESGSMNYSKERKRSPEQFILAGFPLHDNLNPGLKTHKTTSTTPDIGHPGRVLLPY